VLLQEINFCELPPRRLLARQLAKKLNASDFENDLQVELPDYAKITLETMSRNLSSSWTQSGHLVGRSDKIRKQVIPSPQVVTYALLLGYLNGSRGEGLFDTLWVKVIDSNIFSIYNLAKNAAQNGWLDYKKVVQLQR
jgi:hypothetical protein